ncbi:acyltransferase family protein [Thomasclavelia cocleata]|uniref:acyltransferase family protein n=1 Tax=Thomasclavelia cocleata TaxID=69824 RepID=UPI00259121BF|nr:acyltransferase family protein [Thomasclavelia cocleata]
MKKRLQWIDIGKGIGICLMYYGHIGCPDIILRLIYAFHMPLFFFLSGYVLSVDIPIKKFIKKKLSGLIKPFLIFGTFVILGNFIISLLLNTKYDLFDNLYYLFVQQIGTSARLWFIPCLFVSSLICYYILNMNHGMIYYIVLSIIAWLNVYYFNIRIPWYIDIAIICSFFMLLGFRVKDLKCELYLNLMHLFFLTIFFVILTIINSFFGVVDVAQNFYANPILFYVNAILGIIITINIAMRVKNKIIEYIGYNSLLFMFLNSMSIKMMLIIVNIVNITFFDIQIKNIFILIGSIIFVYVISLITKKYFFRLIKIIGFA